jgi:hypothetical protein
VVISLTSIHRVNRGVLGRVDELAAVVREHVSAGGLCGVNADLTDPCLVAGMAGGADSIDDLEVARHGAMGELSGGVRAPATLGSFCGRSPGRACGRGGKRQILGAGVPASAQESLLHYATSTAVRLSRRQASGWIAVSLEKLRPSQSWVQR